MAQNSEVFDAWYTKDVEKCPEGKAKLKELRGQGFSTRLVTESVLNAKFQSLPNKKKAVSGVKGLLLIAKGE